MIPRSSAILVTGGSGQLARTLGGLGGPRVRVVGRPEFDFDQPDGIEPLLEAANPSLVVNAAAYTAVDKAEAEPEAASRANSQGPAFIAQWCARASVPLIHISTDYVFDGAKGAPYVETDPTSPTGVYGRTKRDGELAVLEAGGLAIVLRTSWVYAATGKNFVLTMLNAARTRPALKVVADQIGCPTATPDLARAILAIAERLQAAPDQALAGVYHAAGSGETSWHGLAVAALECAGLTTPVEPIATADWPTPARRPADSRLDCAKLASVFGLLLPPWRESLAVVVVTQAPADPVTVLLATYNGSRFLTELLDSLRAQTHPYRLLWRDDGSADATVAMLRAGGGTELPGGARLGVLRSFLALLRAAEGTVAFCDQDDVWLPEKLARGAAAVAGDEPVLYCARQILVDQAGMRIGASEIIHRCGFPQALTQNIAAGCTIVMNDAARCLVANSQPPTSTLHDWWSYLLVAAAGGRIVCDETPTVLYRQHGGNVVGAPTTRIRRAVAAARRGPGAFMTRLRDHVAALQSHDAMLTGRSRTALQSIDNALRGGVLARIAALRQPGLLRQTAMETAIFRLWFLLG